MKRLSLLLLLGICACKDAPRDVEVSHVTLENSEFTSELEIYDYDGLEPLINKSDNKIHVVNFWATWCAPCVKELPYFEKLNEEYSDKNAEMLLVSLDFPRQYDKKLKPFLKKNQLKSKVVCLDDVDQNRWIPAIDSSWSGAIPATIIYKGDKRKFFEKSFTYEELENELNEFIN